jgi:phage tail-like protein
MPVKRQQPYLNCNFLVDLGGVVVAGFAEATLPSMEIELVDYRDGSDKVNSVRRLPGLTRYGNLTLKRGIVGDLDLFNWIRGVSQGQPDRRNVTVTLLDEQRNPVQAWKVVNALPVKYEGAQLKARSSDVAIESLELACEGLEVE